MDTPLLGQQLGQAARPPHPQGVWELWGAGPGPTVCSQQTGSSKDDFSLLILCLPGGSRAHFHTGNRGGWEGPGRNSLGWLRSLGFLWVGAGVGVGAAKTPEGPLRTQNPGWVPLEVLAPPAPLWLGKLRPRPRDYPPGGGTLCPPPRPGMGAGGALLELSGERDWPPQEHLLPMPTAHSSGGLGSSPHAPLTRPHSQIKAQGHSPAF